MAHQCSGLPLMAPHTYLRRRGRQRIRRRALLIDIFLTPAVADNHFTFPPGHEAFVAVFHQDRLVRTVKLYVLSTLELTILVSCEIDC